MARPLSCVLQLFFLVAVFELVYLRGMTNVIPPNGELACLMHEFADDVMSENVDVLQGFLEMWDLRIATMESKLKRFAETPCEGESTLFNSPSTAVDRRYYLLCSLF